MNKRTTGSQPSGYTCLHFASEGSDRGYQRAWLVQMLAHSQANLEAVNAKGNTPLLLASSQGAADVVETLISAKADIDAVNDRGLLPMQSASQSSSSTMQLLAGAGAAYPTEGVPSARQWEVRSEARQLRYAMRGSRRGRGRGGQKGSQPSDEQ